MLGPAAVGQIAPVRLAAGIEIAAQRLNIPDCVGASAARSGLRLRAFVFQREVA